MVVLVAEDDVLVRNVINAVLSRAGYNVLLAADGEEALKISRSYSGPINLLLSDVVMPRLDGVQLANFIRQERPETKALLVSGKMSSEIAEDNTPFSFLRKPFLPAQLTAKIDEIFRDSSSTPPVEKI